MRSSMQSISGMGAGGVGSISKGSGGISFVDGSVRPRGTTEGMGRTRGPRLGVVDSAVLHNRQHPGLGFAPVGTPALLGAGTLFRVLPRPGNLGQRARLPHRQVVALGDARYRDIARHCRASARPACRRFVDVRAVPAGSG
ncbi:hypothetical protein [Arthrobacter burdickii]|uniref:Uncharacterized protein n=1 Tax=Arthrobacter burdickii TaxID=3035920 RepID=A0ABT8K519_9MICC|nr:hypothetical protein [Arthrobacter burdickii]MDN4612548.1 hypothetical protein [Arthrobacter burdickii]